MEDYSLDSLLEYADMMHVDREDVKKFYEYVEEKYKKKIYTETRDFIYSLHQNNRKNKEKVNK